jgi:UDP-N-acetylglucosamine:LPS N-acetylglucosamine transferase
MEVSLVGRTEIPLKTIPAAGLHGVGLRSLPSNLLQLARGTLQARKVINQFQPDVILFTGGYIGIPVALAGQQIPKVIFSPDIEPALALKWISRIADVITVSAEQSRAFFGKSKEVKVTGYPTRSALLDTDREGAREEMELSSDLPVLLVFGGSRGARSINFALWRRLSEYLQFVEVIHITGELDWPQVERVLSGLNQQELTLYHPHSYLHEEMSAALLSADLVVSRAGASSLGEYPILSLPSILIPYPHAWRYQTVNAKFMVQHRASVIVNDIEIDDRLLPTVKSLISDEEKLSAMATAAQRLAKPEAATSIARELERFATRTGEA